MGTPNFYAALKEFSLNCDNPEGAWGCYDMLVGYLGGLGDEGMEYGACDCPLLGGYESSNWKGFEDALCRLTKEAGVAQMENWWTALLWCGELEGSPIMPDEFRLSSEVRDTLPVDHKFRVARLLNQLHGGRLRGDEFYCNPDKNAISRAYLTALAGDAEAAKLLADAVGFYSQDVRDTSFALESSRGLIEAGQLGEADLTEGYAACSVQSFSQVLGERGDVCSLGKFQYLLRESLNGRPQLVAEDTQKVLKLAFAPCREIKKLIWEASRLDLDSSPDTEMWG